MLLEEHLHPKLSDQFLALTFCPSLARWPRAIPTLQQSVGAHFVIPIPKVLPNDVLQLGQVELLSLMTIAVAIPMADSGSEWPVRPGCNPAMPIAVGQDRRLELRLRCHVFGVPL
jgi:hypothetical protein